MPRFRKRPVVIEAAQWHAGDAPLPGMEPYKHMPWGMSYVINTLEGQMLVTDGDWIITGVKGERYPCKPDIFAASYELVAE